MSRRCFIGLAGSAVAASLVLARDQTSVSGDLRSNKELSAWVWRPELTPTLVKTAASVGVTRLLLWAPPALASDERRLEAWRRLAEDAIQVGIAVDALGGDPHWALTPRLAKSWAEEVASLSLAERLHIDVEPDALGLSGGPADAAYDGMLSSLTELRSVGLPVDSDVPIHYADRRSSSTASFLTQVLELSDSVTIMAYRPTAEEVMAAAGESLRQVRAMHRKAWIGVNLRDPGGDAPSTVLTYRGGDPRSEVESLIQRVQSRGEIAGIALHDSRDLVLLRR